MPFYLIMSIKCLLMALRHLGLDLALFEYHANSGRLPMNLAKVLPFKPQILNPTTGTEQALTEYK